MDGVLQRPWTGYLHMVNTRTQPDIPEVSLRIAYSSFVDGTRVLSLESITDAMPSMAPSCTCARAPRESLASADVFLSPSRLEVKQQAST